VPEASKDEREGELLELLAQAKVLARRYRQLTGRPLGITGEIAEYEAVRLLKLELAPVREAGYDAIERLHGGGEKKIQIKGRCILPGGSKNPTIGRIDLQQPFDSVLLVVLDENFDATVIYESTKDAVTRELEAEGSRARNERGSLQLNRFRRCGVERWATP